MIKKSRLKKKAWEKIDLYHITNSQLFMKIVEDGQMMPGAYTDRVSFGDNMGDTSLELYNPSIHQPDQMSQMQLGELRDLIADRDIKISNELKNEVEKLLNEYNDINTNVQVIENESPSGDSNGIYLSKKPNNNMYKKDSWDNLPYNGFPAFNTEFRIECDTDALGPDLDDGAVNPNDSTVQWKQTLDKFGQCVHYGPIMLDQISGVKFDSLEFHNMEDLDDLIQEAAYDLFGENIKANTWLSLSDANQQCINFYGQLNERIQEFYSYQTANKKSRLIKKAK